MPLHHTYLGYDPIRFGSPHEAPSDLVSDAMEHLLAYGRPRRFTPEELANAIRLDVNQIQGLGPSLEALIALLEARKRKLLETYELKAARRDAESAVAREAAEMAPPAALAKDFAKAIRDENIPALEKLWRRSDESSPFARALLRLIEAIGVRYEIERMESSHAFTGKTPISALQAVDLKEELDEIERLLKQLREALKNARPAIVDLESLSQFADAGDIDYLRRLQRQVNDMLRRMAEEQGLEDTPEGLALTPKAMRLYQSRLLERTFGDLQASRSGRHAGRVLGDGAVELPTTKPYEFGDSIAHLDMTQSMINALVRQRPGAGERVRIATEDLEVHRTRNTPKCATVVILDMSGSMRYGGQYVACKRMALALDGLIRREYPGDRLEFVEMYSLARRVAPREIATLMPKPVSIFDPVVRLRADMSDPTITEMDIPLHFTNLQRALSIARQLLATADTPNRQIVILTDGLPTAHFEGEQLLLLYPPHPRTEEASMREAMACTRAGITLNVFLLPNWNQSEDDVKFAHALAESTGGRVLFTAGEALDRFVVWDYVSRRRSVIG